MQKQISAQQTVVDVTQKKEQQITQTAADQKHTNFAKRLVKLSNPRYVQHFCLPHYITMYLKGTATRGNVSCRPHLN